MDTGRKDYFRRIFAKTGALFVLATEAAGVLAGAEAKTLANLHTFGEKLGTAFQIVDDLLDYVGTEAQVGKPLGSDLAQGLVTLPAICFLESHPDDDRVLRVLNGRRRPEDIQDALQAVRNSEAVAQTKQEAIRRADTAKVALLDLPDNRYRQALLELADFTVERQV